MRYASEKSQAHSLHAMTSAYDRESLEGHPLYLDIGGESDERFAHLRLRTQHAIVRWNLQQCLQGRPAPLSYPLQVHLGMAHVLVNGWEAKFVWDGRFLETSRDKSFGEILQVNYDM